MNTVNTLLERINSARALDFGDIFNDSIQLFKKTWLQGFLLKLFEIVIMLPVLLIFYLPLLFLFIGQYEAGYYDSSAYDDFIAGFSLLYLMFIVAGIFLLSTLSLALLAGFYRIMNCIDMIKM